MNNILMLLSNNFRPDVRVLKEANSLVNYGYNVTIVCWDRRAEMENEEHLDSGVRVIRVQNIISDYGVGAGQIKPLVGFWREAWDIMGKLKPDLVHCHDFDTLPIGVIWAKLHRKPVVYDAHEYYADLVLPRLRGIKGQLLYKLIKIMEAFFSRLANAVVTVDETLAAIYRKLNSRVLVLGHYPPKSLVGEKKSRYKNDTIRLFYSGRISKDRGSLYYLQILRKLIESGIPAKLVLAGIFTPESEAEEFWRHADGLGSHIEFLGWVDYSLMNDVLSTVDVGLVVLMPEPRYMAAVPVKLFDYMAGGLPVIASNFTPIDNIVRTEKCGITINPLENPEIVVEEIIKWYQSPETARNLGENGRRAILNTYNWENLIEKLIQTYQLLLPSK